MLSVTDSAADFIYTQNEPCYLLRCTRSARDQITDSKKARHESKHAFMIGGLAIALMIVLGDILAIMWALT